MIISRNQRMCGLLASISLVAGQSSLGDVLVSNFTEPFRGATPIGNNPNPNDPPDDGPWYWAAQSFMTGGVLNQLDSIEAIVGNGSAAPPPIIVAELHDDDAGQIGNLITTLIAPDVSGSLAAQLFIPATTINLQPGTIYWVVLGCENPSDGTFEFAYADSNDSMGLGDITNWADSQDSGANWNYQTDFPYFLQVNATPGSDSDGDGVIDSFDACCNTPPGVLIDATGRPIGDFDLDCDNDLVDFAIYSQGFTGPLSDPTDCGTSGLSFVMDPNP